MHLFAIFYLSTIYSSPYFYFLTPKASPTTFLKLLQILSSTALISSPPSFPLISLSTFSLATGNFSGAPLILFNNSLSIEGAEASKQAFNSTAREEGVLRTE